MFLKFAKKIFGSANDRFVGKLQKQVESINKLEKVYEKLTDKELKNKTKEFKLRLKKKEALDSILAEAFATVREASKRTLKQRHFDVQLIGGIVLHKGMIAEMKTGEGKTLVSTLPAYLNSLEGNGVHIVTVNDYLAKRDSEWMGSIYKFLGLRVGCITAGVEDKERKNAYECDITYGTNNEFGFDYLRDNMKYSKDTLVQKKHNFAIVDEVDNILIDEARTPLIISGPTEDTSSLYQKINQFIPKLKDNEFEKDEKSKSVNLTDAGVGIVEKILKENKLLKKNNLFDSENIVVLHHVNQALRAHKLFEKDKDYIVRDNQVIIIDEFTGRMMEGRRFSEGLHQALEAKESVNIQNENQTLASTSFQNYFRLYPKLSGMTGTAMTEAPELLDIYNLQVIEIPTNKECVRVDRDDEIYRTNKEKYNAIVSQIAECKKKNQPVLVGTVSIEKSEELSKILKKNNIEHKILNAKYHEQEAYIIAQAGQKGAVTIATNMAGRGTDIQLGGNFDMQIQKLELESNKKLNTKKINEIKKNIEDAKKTVISAGGLFVLGTERHESRRIDNQLRGRCGRQGDIGESKFYISLEDDLMRIFGSDKIDSMLKTLGLEEGEAIAHRWINKALEKAQQKVEARNYDIRKSLLKFDDVMNDQRKVIYKQRTKIMESDDIRDFVKNMKKDVLDNIILKNIPKDTYYEQWNLLNLEKEIKEIFGVDKNLKKIAKKEGVADIEIKEIIQKEIDNSEKENEKKIGSKNLRNVEKTFLLQIIDHSWKDHLLFLDYLKQGISLRAYGQKDPLNEYKREAFELFENMLLTIKTNISKVLSNIHFEPENLEEQEDVYKDQKLEKDTINEENFSGELNVKAKLAAQQFPEEVKKQKKKIKDKNCLLNFYPQHKIPRNTRCVSSGLKYKNCCGKIL
ncbi:MAG: Protein translocase subunit SecA [Alphaproteobacteria bacterium MarineAlpha6_Bin3]|nr:MAG: Protein translocase subunit SecA [Alphaproteobacteria bacterium MarineAlpha6_Bin3]|tara:strand:+ start:3744 stop:6479 length:2736 start_codon:yes stop_codon:yes gene_type:complete